MKPARLAVLAAALAVLVAVPGGLAADHPAAPAAPTATDSRTPLHLDPAAREVLKATMREHLQAIQTVVAALARDDYERASTLAHEELGFPKHHQVMRRERGTEFPARYRELAMAHHREAEDLARAIADRDPKPILERLERTLRACVACHRAYRL
jgi:hypothetical protein